MKSAWMLVAGFLFAWMGAFIKLSSEYFSTTELIFYRSFIGLLLIAPVIVMRHLPLKTPNWRLHVARSFFGMTGMVMFFTCLSLLPLATAMTLNQTAPLFLLVLTALFLQTPIFLRQVIGIFLGFASILLLLGPSISDGYSFTWLLGLGSGFAGGLVFLMVRQLSERGEPEWRVVFYFSFITSCVSGVWALLANNWHTWTLESGALLIGLALSGTLGQLAMTRAYRTGQVLIVGALNYSTVIFSALLGIMLWGDLIPWTGWVAICLFVVSGVLSLRSQAGSKA
ncbi:MAG: DMT family transporter [Pseudomonadota bacterium]